MADPKRLAAIARIAAAFKAYDAEDREVYWALELGGETQEAMWETLAVIALDALEAVDDVETDWPYTTPSGHTYTEPTTFGEVVHRMNDAAQADVESWDAAEHPPRPTWRMVGLVFMEANRLRESADGAGADE